jgi:hypothetical protein
VTSIGADRHELRQEHRRQRLRALAGIGVARVAVRHARLVLSGPQGGKRKPPLRIAAGSAAPLFARRPWHERRLLRFDRHPGVRHRAAVDVHQRAGQSLAGLELNAAKVARPPAEQHGVRRVAFGLDPHSRQSAAEGVEAEAALGVGRRLGERRLSLAASGEFTRDRLILHLQSGHRLAGRIDDLTEDLHAGHKVEPLKVRRDADSFLAANRAQLAAAKLLANVGGMPSLEHQKQPPVGHLLRREREAEDALGVGLRFGLADGAQVRLYELQPPYDDGCPFDRLAGLIVNHRAGVGERARGVGLDGAVGPCRGWPRRGPAGLCRSGRIARGRRRGPSGGFEPQLDLFDLPLGQLQSLAGRLVALGLGGDLELLLRQQLRRMPGAAWEPVEHHVAG